MNKVFELVKKTNDYVVIKVNAEDNLTIAMNPYVSREYDYITITRGNNHLLTVVKKDGKTFSFSWGSNGYTFINEELKLLKSKVIEFIESECFIPYELNTDRINKATVYFNQNFNKWQLTLNDKSYIRPNNVNSFDDIIDYASNYIKADSWKERTAVTGIKVWDAIF